MNEDTRNTAIEALEEVGHIAREKQSWWPVGYARYKRYQAEIDRIDAALADLRARQGTQAPALEPVPDGIYGMLQISHGGRDLGIQIDDQWDAEHGDNNYQWLSDANGKGLPPGWLLMRPADGAEEPTNEQ